MIGRTLSHYKILSEISRGGMGIVYRALDVKLDREVALKVLPPELVSDPERKRRFVQEAKAAAKLEHPHIGMVFEIDEANGTTFIAMELIRGEQLRDTIAKGPVPLRRALEIATDIAEGLAKAHDEGIVHRDLKPANVMVTEDGHTKIIDFGLAKLVEPLAGKGSDIETFTRGETDPGKVMGTVSYMSPEQARGAKVDHRSDIFSFGIVLHEMLTGKLPFRGPSAPETLSAIINSPTPELELPAHKDMAPELQRVMDKCLAKEPEERFQAVKDVVVDLRATRRRLESGAARPTTKTQAKRPWGWVIAGAVLAAVIVIALYGLRPSAAPEESGRASSKPSIAVLLFDNINEDSELDWLRVGLAEMLVTDLSQSPNVRVLSTEELYQILKDMNKLDERVTSLNVLQEVAEKANSGLVVHGSFMKAGESIRINIRVQDAASGEILTTDKVEGLGGSNIFPMVDELTRSIKDKLDVSRVASGREIDEHLGMITTSSVEAYRYYTEGMKLQMAGRTEESVPFYEKAVEADPDFALAHVRLWARYGGLGLMERSREHSRRAVELSDRLPANERYYIEGNYYSSMGWKTYDQSIEAHRKALELYPEHVAARTNLALRYLRLERYNEAIELLAESTPGWTAWFLAECYAVQGDFESGLVPLKEWVSREPEALNSRESLATHLGQWGRHNEALEIALQLEDKGPSARRLAEHIRFPIFIQREEWLEAEASVSRTLEEVSTPRAQRTALMKKAVIRLYRGRAEEALSLLDEADRVSLTPGTFWVGTNSYAAHVLIEDNDIAAALEKARRDQRQREGDVAQWDALLMAALAQARLGHMEQAEKTAEELRLDVRSPQTPIGDRLYHHLLGELALTRRDIPGALQELELANSMLSKRGVRGFSRRPPDHVPIWFSLARANLEAGETSKAAVWFRRIADSTTEHIYWPIPYVRSFYFLGKIHENQGDMEKARGYYRRFYEYWKDGDMDRERVEEATKKLAS